VVRIFKDQPADAIMCHLGMPEINGSQVASRIQAICRERLVQKPSLILSTKSETPADRARKMEESGVDLVVEKAAGDRKLTDAIGKVVRRNEQRTKI